MSDRRKIVIFIVVLLAVVVFIIRINIPCKFYQLPFIYGVIRHVEQTEIPKKIILDDDSAIFNKDDELFEFRKASIDFSNRKAELSLYIYDQNQEQIFNLIVAEVSEYLVEHPNAFLNECMIDISLFDMGHDVIKARNYNADGQANNKPYTFTIFSEE